MDGTPHLLTDVKFSERRKGYDPDEVDNFLERVSAAVAQLQDKLRDATTKAEEADARINEAKRSQAVAEAQVDQLKADLNRAQAEGVTAPAAPAAPVSATDDAEKASALLVMAQKTADAAIEESRRKAESAVSEARSKATALVGDAEAEADRIRSDARRIADDLVEQKRTAAIAEVTALEQLKGQIQYDVDVLERHVSEERSGLQQTVDRLTELLADPSTFRVGAAPDVSDASSADIIADEPDADEADEVVDEVADADVEIVDESDADEGPVLDLGGESDDEVEETDEVDPDDEADAEALRITTAADASDDDPDAVSDRLFAPPSEADSGPPTEAFQPFAADAPKAEGFGKGNDDEDQAMRAFFETDFDTVEAEKRSRWRR